MSGPNPTDTFRQEVRELLEQVEIGLLDLEQRPDDGDLVNGVFRALHTIKGSGAMFGFTAVAEFVHEFETAFDRVRKGLAHATPQLIGIALSARDHIEALISNPDAHAEQGIAILAELRRAVASSLSPVDDPVDHVDLEDGEPPVWRVKFTLAQDVLLFGTNPVLLLDELSELGSAIIAANTDAVPDLDDIDPTLCYFGWDVELETIRPRSDIEDVFIFVRDGMDLLIEPVNDVARAVELRALHAAAETAAAPSSAPRRNLASAPKEPGAAISTAPEGASLRVPAERLDELMDRVGELVIAQARLSQMAAACGDPNFKAMAEELGRLSSGLRDTTMGIRMVPIGTLFGRFRRLVHDLSNDLGKDIEFITTGEDTELDKTVIERLADPLVHLIRNAVDHGLESAEARAASGKSATGTVKLQAAYAGTEVMVSVSDDGAGLNAERIRAKAIESGLIGAETRLTEQELFQLIFAPGFSTAKEVSALSGRGVGMDVVKRNVEGLRGKIELTSKAGEGTTATLRLPLTLAIIDGLLVRVGDGRYVIPLAAVEECVELPAGLGHSRSGRDFLDIRGGLVPFLRLNDMFGVEGAATDENQKVVVVSSGTGRVGLVVDKIIGNNQTVIKQLSVLHAGIKTFSGATILGDGNVALILDTSHLVGVQGAERADSALTIKDLAA